MFYHLASIQEVRSMAEEIEEVQTKESLSEETPPEEGALEGAPVEARLSELEALAQEQAQRLASQEAELSELRGQLSAAGQALAQAAVRYRSALLVAYPEVPPELVSDATIEEVERSFEAARATVERVRRQLEGQTQAGRVPPGAPLRRGPDVSALSPKEKIAYALGSQR